MFIPPSFGILRIAWRDTVGPTHPCPAKTLGLGTEPLPFGFIRTAHQSHQTSLGSRMDPEWMEPTSRWATKSCRSVPMPFHHFPTLPFWGAPGAPLHWEPHGAVDIHQGA